MTRLAIGFRRNGDRLLGQVEGRLPAGQLEAIRRRIDALVAHVSAEEASGRVLTDDEVEATFARFMGGEN